MVRRTIVGAVLCLSAVVQSAAAGTKVDYYKAGDVGVFAATLPVPADLDVATSTLFARAAGGKAYLLYVQSPVLLVERARASSRYETPPLNAEQQAKADALDKQIQQLYRRVAYPYEAVNKAKQKIEGLKALLDAELAKPEGRDEAFIARTRESLKALEAEVKQLEGGWQKAGDENTKTYARISELQAEKEKIWAAARKQLREDELTLPLQVFGRFQGAGRAAATVHARSSDALLSEPRLVALLDLDLPAADGGDPALLKQWATAQARDFALRVLESPYSSYYQYALLQSVRKHDVPSEAIPRRLVENPPERRRPDLYSMATGGLAIQESLQLDTMTRREEIPEDRGVPLESLQGPAIKSHPFDKMLEGRTPRVFPAAALVPFDAYYCHFSSISKEIATSDLLKTWGSSLLGMVQVSARDSDLPSKYQEQLCIGISVLTRLVGDLVIGEVALTGNDPFLMEGTDVTVLIQVKNRAVFDRQMKGYIDDALSAYPEAKTAALEWGGVPVLAVTTPDRRISSYSCTLGDYAVYSNSLDALQRVIDTAAKRRKSMAENLDFQYMRTLFPGTPEAEDGFIYLSDPFIRKLVGPRWKIEAQRRIVCQNHLRMLGNAATLYRMERRKAPTVEALLKEDYLPDAAATCPDGGTYSLDATGRAACSVHNVLRYCTPVDSVAVAKVSQAEARDYKAFVENYNTYWRQYFDPIGIRFKVGDHVEVETCILPLIESSMYNQLRDLVGGQPVQLAGRVLTDRTILSITSKLDLSRKEYREGLDNLQRALFPSIPPIERAIGPSFSINLCDSDVLFTFDERGFGIFGGWMNLEDRLILATILSSINLPMYGVLELRDEALADTILRELVKVADVHNRLEERRDWDDFFGLEHYRTDDYKGHTVHTLALRLAMIRFRLHYAIAHKRLVVATKPWVLAAVLDALDKGPDGEQGAEANFRIDLRPRAFDRLVPITTIGWQERLRDACLLNLVAARALIENQDAAEATLGEASRRFEGVTLRCPSGGTYRHDPARDLVYCDVHGDMLHPRQPVAPTGQEELVRFVRRLRDFSITFRFTPEGIMTKVALDLDPEKK